MSRHKHRYGIQSQQAPLQHHEPPIHIQEPVTTAVAEYPEDESTESDEFQAEDPIKSVKRELEQLNKDLAAIEQQRQQKQASIIAAKDKLAQCTRTERPDRRFWPGDEPLPEVWIKRQMPCHNQDCLRLLTDEGGQAVVVTSSGEDIATFRCKVCGHRWSLPTEKGLRKRKSR